MWPVTSPIGKSLLSRAPIRTPAGRRQRRVGQRENGAHGCIDGCAYVQYIGSEDAAWVERYAVYAAEAWEASFSGLDPEFSAASIVEAELGVPTVSSFSTWYRCLVHLGRRTVRPAGRLLDSLG